MKIKSFANENQETRIIAVNQQIIFNLENTELLHFTTIPDFEASNLKNNFNESPYYALLDIKDKKSTLVKKQKD